MKLVNSIAACVLLCGFLVIQSFGGELFSSSNNLYTHAFVFSTQEKDEEWGIGKEIIKGNIRELEKNSDSYVIQLEILDIERSYSKAHIAETAQNNKPFKAKITLTTNNKSLISINIYEGAYNHDENPRGISTQYRTAYNILELMLLTSWGNSEFVSARDSGNAGLIFNSKPINNVNLVNLGATVAPMLRSMQYPLEYSGFPEITQGKLRRWHLHSLSHDSLNITMHSRVLDVESGMVVHAVSLEATPVRGGDERSLHNILSLIDRLDDFSSYDMSEYRIVRD